MVMLSSHSRVGSPLTLDFDKKTNKATFKNKKYLVTAVKYLYGRHKSVHISRICGVPQIPPCAGDGTPTSAVLGEGA